MVSITQRIKRLITQVVAVTSFKADGITENTDSAGNPAVNVTQANIPAQAENLNYPYTFSQTVAAMGSTAAGYCNSLGLPFDTLTFTKSGAVNPGIVFIHLVVGGGMIVIDTLTAETIAITATSDGNDMGNILLVDSTGAIVSATGLAVGTYFLYLGK